MMAIAPRLSWRWIGGARSDGGVARGACSPTGIGWITRGGPPKASLSDSASTRYWPSLSEEMAYMTTKKASSSVTRSP